MPETGIVNNREPEVTIRFGRRQGFVYAGVAHPGAAGGDALSGR